jgi:hypothetical protein
MQGADQRIVDGVDDGSYRNGNTEGERSSANIGQTRVHNLEHLADAAQPELGRNMEPSVGYQGPSNTPMEGGDELHRQQTWGKVEERARDRLDRNACESDPVQNTVDGSPTCLSIRGAQCPDAGSHPCTQMRPPEEEDIGDRQNGQRIGTVQMPRRHGTLREERT